MSSLRPLLPALALLPGLLIAAPAWAIKCPNLQIVLGHIGQGLQYSMWRIDHRNEWMKKPRGYAAKKNISKYFQNKFHLTTAGNFRAQTLIAPGLQAAVRLGYHGSIGVPKR